MLVQSAKPSCARRVRAAARGRRRSGAFATASPPPPPSETEPQPLSLSEPARRDKPLPGSRVNLFDPAATLSRFLTRRFGIVGGLSLVAVLAATEGASIVKALLEGGGADVADAAWVALPSGVRVRDTRLGGGASPSPGDFVGFDLRVETADEAGRVLVDTQRAGGKPVAFLWGKAAPGVVCAGLLEALASMKRGGVREVEVPAAQGYAPGARLAGGETAPGGALRLRVALKEVTGFYQ